jgi:hypothetical protein
MALRTIRTAGSRLHLRRRRSAHMLSQLPHNTECLGGKQRQQQQRRNMGLRDNIATIAQSNHAAASARPASRNAHRTAAGACVRWRVINSKRLSSHFHGALNIATYQATLQQ